MKLLQFTGPFTRGQKITVPSQNDYSYVHIGIQIPKRDVMHFSTDALNSPDIMINKVSYQIQHIGILEFDDLAELSWDIEFLKDLPAESIIDIVYDISEY